MTTDDSISITRSPAAPKRRSLGKGLGALLGEAAEDYAQLDVKRAPAAAAPAAPAAPGAPSKISIELLAPGPYQPRRNFTPIMLQELAESIKEKGMIQPILVRRDPAKAGQYQIVAGERRWRAAQLAGLHEVPVIVREMSDAEMAEIAIVENIQREDLTMLEEAHAYQQLITDFGHRQEDVAKMVGKSRAYIANTMRLLKLPPEAQSRIDDGLLTAGKARLLLSVGDDDAHIFNLILSDETTVRDAEQIVQQHRAKTGAKPAKGKLRDANTVALEKMVATALGLSVSIAGRGQKGSLTIRYQNLDQLDDLLKKLCGTIQV